MSRDSFLLVWVCVSNCDFSTHAFHLCLSQKSQAYFQLCGLTSATSQKSDFCNYRQDPYGNARSLQLWPDGPDAACVHHEASPAGNESPESFKARLPVRTLTHELTYAPRLPMQPASTFLY